MKLTADRLIHAINNSIEGYESSDALKILREDFGFTDIEFNRLFVRNETGKGIVCKFNEWTGNYPFSGIELEEIGYLQTESNERTN